MKSLAIISLVVASLWSASQAYSLSNNKNPPPPPSNNNNKNHQARRSFVSSLALVTGSVLIQQQQQSLVANAADENDNESFASIAARASKISQAKQQAQQEETPDSTTTSSFTNTQTAYDFTLPMAGIQVPIKEIVRNNNNNNVKAILFVNIKQDDIVARKNIPELIALASKFGRNGEFVVVCCPTDQGYYEPDTSALIRLKMASEYGYGINPATVVTDKVNVLGTGAVPFWRWLEGSCRTPQGLGRIQANFEKFLVDGKTGLPLRRYPRKYQPFDIQNDIQALMEDKTSLPPPGANWKEEWRSAIKEAEADTYRFQKGLNYYDQ